MTDTHPIIKKLLENNIEVRLALVESPFAHKHMAVVYRVMGFYSRLASERYADLHNKMFFDSETPKQGFVALYDQESHMIRTTEDLVKLNYAAWRLACQRMRTELPPTPGWAALYEEWGLVEVETTTRYVPVGG